MKIAIMQPYFLPYLGYWQLIHAVDEFVLLDDVNFIKKGYINRNSILSQGKPQRFTLPVEGTTQNKLICELSFQLEDKNRKKLMSTLSQSYQKAPMYESVYPMLKTLFYYKDYNLTSFILHSFQVISSYLEINTGFIRSSELKKDDTKTGQERILEICRVLKTDRYINAIGGQALYSKDDFEKEGISLQFIKMDETITYPQFAGEFVPNLSILDVLMFHSKEEIRQLLERYTLI